MYLNNSILGSHQLVSKFSCVHVCLAKGNPASLRAVLRTQRQGTGQHYGQRWPFEANQGHRFGYGWWDMSLPVIWEFCWKAGGRELSGRSCLC